MGFKVIDALANTEAIAVNRLQNNAQVIQISWWYLISVEIEQSYMGSFQLKWVARLSFSGWAWPYARPESALGEAKHLHEFERRVGGEVIALPQGKIHVIASPAQPESLAHSRQCHQNPVPHFSGAC